MPEQLSSKEKLQSDSLNRSTWITSLIPVVTSVMGAVIATVTVGVSESRPSALILTFATLMVVGAVAALQVATIARSQPRLKTISLLGFPGVGKTVYLSVLYNEMMIHASHGVQFRPYGMETAERVNEAMRRLRQGQWLPRSAANEVFFHRARASFSSGLFTRRYKIEIPDFAGEHIAEFDASSPTWLHRTEYFRYVIESDAIFLCLDCETLLSPDPSVAESHQSALLTAMQVLMDIKDIVPPRRIEVPIALLFLKGDLAPKVSERELEERAHHLTAFLQSHCRVVRSFKVSSVGQLLDEHPARELRPDNVVEPLIWALKH